MTLRLSKSEIEKIRMLGQELRLKILEILAERSLSWGDLEDRLGVNPNTLNFHLGKLLSSKFIRREVRKSRGRSSTYYSITSKGLEHYQRLRA
jgi:predicted ArsR family transcriptional regulator